MNLDQELRRALKREDPPPGFADKVLTRLATGQAPKIRLAPSRRPWLALPVAASVLAASGWSVYVHRQHQAEAERAAYQVTTALQIAGEKLVGVQKKVQDKLRNQYEPHDQN